MMGGFQGTNVLLRDIDAERWQRVDSEGLGTLRGDNNMGAVDDHSGPAAKLPRHTFE